MSVTVDGTKTLQSLQVPSSDIDNGLYTVKSTIEHEQATTDDQIEYRNWFNTPVLDEETIKRLHSIQLLAESCDQGFADVPSAGNWTWFEVGVYVDVSASILKEKEGIKLVWKSHSNRFMSQEYGWSEGILFDRKHKIFGMLSPRNIIGVRLCAHFPGWSIMVKSGFLVVELGPKIAERMVPEFKSIVNDGSGVHGLSALYILRDVMNKTAPEKKTCEIFDMIAGTSAGGLIAIMLGHLEMTVDECITEYETLSHTTFAKYKFGDKLMQGGRLEATGAHYDSSILENAFKEFVGKKLGTKDIKLLNEQGSCKVCVMATLSLLPDCLVWQAGRATSTAPSYFTPVKVGMYKLVDGGLLANNPLGWFWSELLDIFGPARRTACFLSLGTSIPANQRVGRAHILD
ncbi:FabD/lysophospholipase-like protein [Tricholoma matsutake]|nr:FabD/lysophospholipase-like protein [Tricholoma matsutake 945]